MAKILNEKQKKYLKEKWYSACIDFELDRACVKYCGWDIDQKLIDETQIVLNNAKRDLEELKKLGEKQWF